MSKKTPLFNEHITAGGKLVDFFGWQLPIHYGSQLQEHNFVRNDVGMFDVSHMTVVDLLGAGARQFLRYLLANDVDKLHNSGQALYSLMLNNHGGIIDDLIVYFRTPDNYRLVLNAATRDKDLAWIKQQIGDFSVGLQERPELAMLAIQGPNAIMKVMQVLNPVQADAVCTLQNFESVDINEWFLARTGYTGEDGLEIILPQDAVSEFWNKLLAAGVHPCGLGARDTLRLEAGMMLYGQDMDESNTPLDSSLSWSIAWDSVSRDFIGQEALRIQKVRGVKQKIVGLVLSEKGIMRAGQKVFIDSQESGIITSGTYSPTLEKSIALARVSREIGENCFVEIRGKKILSQVTKPRFIKHGKVIV